MRYVESRYHQYNLDKAYRLYVTDSLRVIGKLNIRFADMIRDFDKNKEPTETAEEIKSRIVGGLNKIGG